MNTTLDEGKQLINDVLNGMNASKSQFRAGERKVIFGVPYITLAAAAGIVYDHTDVHVAAQNCYSQEKGAFTGEISVDMIKSTGAEYVIIGHSERREYFGEDERILAKKIDLVLSRELLPIFCCGEKLDLRETGDHFDLVKKQVEGALFHLNIEEIRKVIVAYEPVWAIGTGVTASPEQAEEMHAFIRNLLSDKYGQGVADEISILYGGSVNAKTAEELFSQPDVDGGLVGGASLKAGEFLTIINAF